MLGTATWPPTSFAQILLLGSYRKPQSVVVSEFGVRVACAVLILLVWPDQVVFELVTILFALANNSANKICLGFRPKGVQNLDFPPPPHPPMLEEPQCDAAAPATPLCGAASS